MSGVELRARPKHLFAYSGESLLVCDLDGLVTGSETEGFYFRNTRLLSRDELRADGQRMQAIGVSPVVRHALLAYYLVPPGDGVPEQGVYLEVARFLDEGMRVVLTARNYSREPARFGLELFLAADFMDIMEAEQGSRQQSGTVATSWEEEQRSVVWRYSHPAMRRAVAVRVERAPSAPLWRDDEAIVFTLEVPPRQPVEIEWTVEPEFDGEPARVPPRSFAGSGPASQAKRELDAQAVRLSSSNATVAGAWRTALADLTSLPLGLPEGPATPSAGFPMYQHFFGRDALTTAWQAVMAMPAMLRDALEQNAALQGTSINDWRDEEPGKLIHQARQGPMSVAGVDPLTRYYGDYATPVDFLAFLGQYLAWSGDVQTVRRLLPSARAAFDWLERYGDVDGDGFIEYETRSEGGVEHQGWKDAPDSVVGADGQSVDPPVATCELQAYWYGGLRQMASAAAILGDRGFAGDLLRRAARLQRSFNEAFWMPDEGFYALGLDADKQQIRSITSNPGHLLSSAIVPPERARAVARRLLEPDVFSGWGVRTLSTHNPAYDPFSYHRGSVWPVENATFAFGFARYGLVYELHRLARAVFDASELFADQRIPEVLGGLPRDPDRPHPGLYPEANAPQAWSASAIVMIVQALLGARAMAPMRLLLVDPHLPAWLPDLRVEGIPVGSATVDLELWRDRRGRTRCRVAGRSGAVAVIRQPPLQAGRSAVARAAALVRSPL